MYLSDTRYFELILELNEIEKEKQYEISIAGCLNIRLPELIELSLDIIYKCEILGMDEWFVHRKMMQDSIVSRNTKPKHTEILLVMNLINEFAKFIDSRLSAFNATIGPPVLLDYNRGLLRLKVPSV